MAIKKSVLNTKGRYVQGGTTTQHPNRMGWWERTIYPNNDNDVFIEIPAIAHRRPDIFAYNYFGKSSLAWLVLQFNHIVDINEEFNAGTVIAIPNPSSVLLNLNGKKGGIKPNQ